MKNLWLFLAFSSGLVAAPPTLIVSPSDVQLNGKEARLQLIAEASVDGYHEDWTRGGSWKSSNPNIVAVADGDAVVTASAKGQSATVKVHVKNAKAPFQWSFKNHVMPVLTKSGCNQ